MVLLAVTPISARADSPRPTIIHTDETGVTLRWEFPAPAITTDGAFSAITLPGFPADGTPGAPKLPHATTLIGLPPTGGATLKITAIQIEEITLPAPPLPAKTLVPQGNPPIPTEEILPDAALYAQNALFPATAAELSPPMQIRFNRVVRLTINPVRVNPAVQTATIIRAITVQILFDDVPPRFENYSVTQSGPFNPIAKEIINPAAAQWKVSRADLPRTASAATAPEAKLTVTQRGLTAVTCAQIETAGLAVSDPRKLQLTTGYPRQPVAAYFPGEADGVCDPADRLYFFADPAFSRTTDEGVYFVSSISGSPARMATRSGSPAGLPAGAVRLTAVAEENKIYDDLFFDHSGDRWFWTKLDALATASADIPITLENPQNAPAELTLWLQGTTAETHRVRVRVNGQIAGEGTWSGKTAFAFSAAVNGAWLHSGQNTVTITVIDGTSALWVDGAKLVYAGNPTGGGQVSFSGESSPHAYTLSGWQNTTPIVLDVTHPATPTRVSGWTLGGGGTLSVGDDGAAGASFLVAAEATAFAPVQVEMARTLSAPPAGADMIIITHPDFAAAIAPLAAFRAAQGLRVVTVDVRNIYDAFGDGRASAAAIKTFLADALGTWAAPAPSFVLLVGDGSYDWKNYAGWGNPNFIPPFLAPVDPRNYSPWSAETAADNRFVTLTGNDNFPDMLIGRLPVNSATEAATVVDKILWYEKTPVPGEWNQRQLLVSDNCDTAGNFYTASDAAMGYLAPPKTGVRFYYPQDSGAPCAYNKINLYNNVATLRTDFLKAFNAGAGLVMFNGHSSWHQWAGGNRTTGAEESVFHWNRDPALNDVDDLKNGYQLPIVLEMTCFTGYFHHPEYPTLDESLLRQNGGGAVAVWGATGLGVATGHGQLQAGFYKAVFTDGERNLGAGVLAGKAKLFANGFNQDLLDTFTLFGDPALGLNFTEKPFTDFVYLPLIAK